MNEKLFKKASTLNNNDFQNRKGDYPKSNIPDTVEVYTFKDDIVFFASFKNTTEATGQQYVERYLDNQGFKYTNVHSNQAGDYTDDWIDVYAIITG